MSDPVFTPHHYLLAHDVVRHTAENLAIQFQVEGEGWNGEKMQEHIMKRAALLRTAKLLLDAGEQLAKNLEAQP